MSQRAWRSLHYFGYAVWVLALVHGVLSGTDSRSPVALICYGASAAIVAAAAWSRWMLGPPAPRRSIAPAPAAPLPVRVAIEIEGGER